MRPMDRRSNLHGGVLRARAISLGLTVTNASPHWYTYTDSEGTVLVTITRVGQLMTSPRCVGCNWNLAPQNVLIGYLRHFVTLAVLPCILCRNMYQR